MSHYQAAKRDTLKKLAVVGFMFTMPELLIAQEIPKKLRRGYRQFNSTHMTKQEYKIVRSQEPEKIGYYTKNFPPGIENSNYMVKLMWDLREKKSWMSALLSGDKRGYNGWIKIKDNYEEQFEPGFYLLTSMVNKLSHNIARSRVKCKNKKQIL